MFQDAHTDARTHGRTGQNHYASGHITLGGGIKIVTDTVVYITKRHGVALFLGCQ